MELSKITKNHITYLAAEDISNICKPLFTHCQINAFGFTKRFKDGSYLHLTTCRQGFYHAIQQNYSFVESKPLTSGIYLWENCLCNTFLKDEASLFNLHNGVSIINNNGDSLESVCLTSPPNNYSAIDFSFNHLDLLNQFIFYFKEKANKLIQQAYKERFVFPNAMQSKPLDEKSYEEFRDLIKTKTICLNFKSKEIILSKREYEVLLQFAKGKATKEVAKTLNISPRTVEGHLTNAKNKSNCIFKSQLIGMLRDGLLGSL